MPASSLLDDVRHAAKDHQVSEHRLRLAVTAACEANLPIASIAKAAGVTRQTVYNWSSDYGQGNLTVSASTALTDLPIQRPHAPKKTPVLILTRGHGRRMKWDGRFGAASGYAGDLLGVSVPGKIVDVIAESWALAGDSTGAGRRPDVGDLVICPSGVLGTVTAETPASGEIHVEVQGQLQHCQRWAIVLPGATADA